VAGESNRTEDWKTLPWKQFQRNVFRLQKRIYQAQLKGTRHKSLLFEEPDEAKSLP